MQTRRLKVEAVKRDHPISVASPADFTFEEDGEITLEAVFGNPKLSLYCFDPENDAALFLEVDDPVAVDKAPFYYQAQAAHAVGAVSMPLKVFHQFAQQIPEPTNGLIFIHSVGRCGSTLLSKVLEGIPSIHSLSEPDDLTQLVNLRVAGKLTDEEVRRLVVSSVRWRCKPRQGPEAKQVAIKTRSEVLVLADLIGPAFPLAKHFFLYRDGVAWMRTLFRGWPAERDVYDQELNRKMEDGWARTVPLVKQYRRDEGPMNPIQIRMMAWITCMEGYLLLRDMGIPIAAARYEDIVTDPMRVLDPFFDFCGIENVDRTVLEEILSRDSQAGTIYDREERRKSTRELTPELEKDVKDLLDGRPLLRTPGVILPGTLGL